MPTTGLLSPGPWEHPALLPETDHTLPCLRPKRPDACSPGLRSSTRGAPRGDRGHSDREGEAETLAISPSAARAPGTGMAAAQSLPGQTPLPPGTSKPSPWRRSLAEAVASHVVGTQPPVEVKAGAVQVGHTILAPSPCPRPTHRVPCLGLSLDLLSTHGEWCTFMKDEPELEVPSDARRPPHSKAGRRTPPCAPRSPTARQCQVWGGAVCLLSDHGAPRSSGTAPAPPLTRLQRTLPGFCRRCCGSFSLPADQLRNAFLVRKL